MLKMPKPSKEYTVSIQATTRNLKDKDVLCIFEINTGQIQNIG